MHNNRTPERIGLNKIGSGGVEPTYQANYVYITNAMLLANASEPTVKSKEVVLEEQFMRRENRNFGWRHREFQKETVE